MVEFNWFQSKVTHGASSAEFHKFDGSDLELLEPHTEVITNRDPAELCKSLVEESMMNDLQ